MILSGPWEGCFEVHQLPKTMKNVERGSRSWIAAACLSALLANGTCAQQMPDAIDVEETAAIQQVMVP